MLIGKDTIYFSRMSGMDTQKTMTSLVSSVLTGSALQAYENI